jgi:hypothetical protein
VDVAEGAPKLRGATLKAEGTELTCCCCPKPPNAVLVGAAEVPNWKLVEAGVAAPKENEGAAAGWAEPNENGAGAVLIYKKKVITTTSKHPVS